ncbi:class I SAM-dependent methyltransferase [bacterium]|nr:class I SAM-dependent methyltransferase [bacterium]
MKTWASYHRNHFFVLIKHKIKLFLGKIGSQRIFYNLIRRLFILANKEMYRKSLTSFPVLSYSNSQDWVRVPMYGAIFIFFKNLAKKENLRGKQAIEIGGSEGSIKRILEKFGIKYQVAPDYPEMDIQEMPYLGDSFDFLIIDQVLEHVEKPWIAEEEIYRVLKPGGIFIATAPFMVAIHGDGNCKDYYRFTPEGWKSLFSDFEILEVGGWGNKEVVRLSLDSSVNETMFGVTIPVNEIINKKLLQKNDHKHYLVTWCIGRKPLTNQNERNN